MPRNWCVFQSLLDVPMNPPERDEMLDIFFTVIKKLNKLKNSFEGMGDWITHKTSNKNIILDDVKD